MFDHSVIYHNDTSAPHNINTRSAMWLVRRVNHVIKKIYICKLYYVVQSVADTGVVQVA